ncbi:MAG: iron transporter substrate-binding protein [Tardiphaga sp.]|nr:iron transporter substrate-binding protein [Tardiphaga sp.]
MASACAEEINLYSTREAPLVEPVIAAFTASSGIHVKLTFIENNLAKRMVAEGNASPADVLMTIGLDKTSQFVSHGLTQKLASSAIDSAVPAALRNGEGQWISLSVRPRVIVARADAALAAIRYEDLADPKWHGQLCMRSALHQNNVALVAAYLLHHGADATEAWLRGIKANVAHAPAGKDNDVIREIAQGTCTIGIANTVALAQLRDDREGADWKQWAGQVKALPTTFENGGTHVNLTGAAVAKNAPHRAAAIAFLDFLVTPAAQKLYAAAELEYPVLAAAEPHPLVAAMGAFTPDTVPIDQIAANQKAAVILIRKVDFGG